MFDLGKTRRRHFSKNSGPSARGFKKGSSIMEKILKYLKISKKSSKKRFGFRNLNIPAIFFIFGNLLGGSLTAFFLFFIFTFDLLSYFVFMFIFRFLWHFSLFSVFCFYFFHKFNKFRISKFCAEFGNIPFFQICSFF